VVTLAPRDMDFYNLHRAVRRIALDLAGESRSPFTGLVNNLRRIHALRRVLRQVQPDAALAMMSTANVLLAFAALGLSGVAVVGSEHIYPPQLPLGRLWECLRSYAYGRLLAVTALTEESASWLKANTHVRRVPVIPNAVSWPLTIQAPAIDPIQVLPEGKRVLLAVGRLSEQKQFDLLIDAFTSLAPSHPDWVLVILGEGPDRGMLEARVRSGELRERILLPGRVGNVGHWYEAADLYVMSSRFEGFSNTLIEALAHGLPAVSFDCDTGPRDIIRHEVDGLLVPPGNIKALKAALERLMEEEALRAHFGERAVDAKERFSMEKVAGMWEKLFEEVKRFKD
jgi:glycosyltransferase involved in cell wall biosynthesis